MILYPCKLTVGFQQQLVHLPSAWLVNQETLLSQHLAEQGFDTWRKFDNHVEGIMQSISSENP